MKKSICKSCGVLKYLDENSLCFKCRVPLDELGELKKLVDELTEKVEVFGKKVSFKKWILMRLKRLGFLWK